jgi:predicted HAD superfamily Cof-like phosphohydrolase
MFTEQLPLELFQAQKEFIRVMESNLDFKWWAEVLVTEETKELKQADEQNEGMEQIFKEMADLVYVVAGFYNVMPVNPATILSEENNQKIQAIFEEAAETATTISQKYRIPPPLIVEAFKVVHESNMSKLDDEGKPIRREDGKILKGPNYKAPDMTPVVEMWKNFTANVDAAEKAAENDSKTSD